MKITYDAEVDVLYIRFRDAARDTTLTSRHAGDDIALDYDRNERLAGIEILDASRVVADPAALDGATFERL
jgi:uncharacterized protein YuzE